MRCHEALNKYCTTHSVNSSAYTDSPSKVEPECNTITQRKVGPRKVCTYHTERIGNSKETRHGVHEVWEEDTKRQVASNCATFKHAADKILKPYCTHTWAHSSNQLTPNTNTTLCLRQIHSIVVVNVTFEHKVRKCFPVCEDVHVVSCCKHRVQGGSDARLTYS